MSSPTDPRSSSNPVPMNTGPADAPPTAPVVNTIPACLPPTDPVPGTDAVTVVGVYRLVRELGRGGMGVVYEAEDQVLGRRVALKLMNPQTAADGGFRERFLREGRAVAALKSDHVVNVYAAGEHGGQLYLAMEYIDGPTLDGWLKGRAVTVEQVLWVAGDLLSGLAAAHAKGLIHRDVKPGNVMLDETAGRLKLLDFGLVRDVSARPGGAQATATVGALGTPAYMSPEQAREQKLDARTDLFSAGVVLYRLVRGKSPFARASVTESMCAVLTEPPPPLTGVPRQLSAFVARLMAYDPNDRPRDAREALVELRRLEAELGPRGEVTVSEIASNSSSADITLAGVRPSRSKSKLPLVLAGVAVLLAAVVAVLLTRGGKPKDEVVEAPPQPQKASPETLAVTPKVEPKGDATTSPVPKVEPKVARPLPPAEVLKLIVADIDRNPGSKAFMNRPARLFLFAPYLAPGSSLTADERKGHRAAMDALAARLRPEGEMFRPLDADRTVFAVEPAFGPVAPNGLLAEYPYGLTFEQPKKLERDDLLAREYTVQVSFVRADWFVRAISRRLMRNEGAYAKGGRGPKLTDDWAAAWGDEPVTLARAADELGVEPDRVKDVIRRHGPLTKTYGLGPLLDGKTVTRAQWESREFTTSAFQELARELGVGLPKLTE